MSRKVNLSILAGALLMSAAAFAAPSGFDQGAAAGGPAGFNNQAPNTVAGVLANGYDDQIVTLTGALTNYLGDDRYEFTDQAGDRIEVELDDDRSWNHIAKDMPIQIVGQVDKDLMSTTLEVQSAQPLQN